MFLHPRSIRIRQTLMKQRRSNLRFDTLEERRVMATLEVFLYDDADASKSFNSHADSPLVDRPVFVDINRDGRFDPSEPWTTTDLDGIARFQNLTPGEVVVRLLGENQRVLQTSPTTPSSESAWVDNVGTVLHVEIDGSVWTFLGNQVIKRNQQPNANLQKFSFDADIESVVIDEVNDNVAKAFVTTSDASGQKKLWLIPNLNVQEKILTTVDVSGHSQVLPLGSEVLIRNALGLSRVAVNPIGKVVSSGPIAGATLDDSSVLKKSGTNGFAVLNTMGLSSELSMYEIAGTSAVNVGRRSFSSEVLAWQPSPDGESIAVSTLDDFLIVEKGIGLPTVAILQDAVAPILFDAKRSMLLTGNQQKENELVGWQTNDWTKSLVVPITDGELSGRDTELNLDRLGRFLVGNRSGRAYSHDLAEAVLVTATISANGTSQVQIGLKLLGQNTPPSLSMLTGLNLNEDETFHWSTSLLRSASADLDSDGLIYLMRSGPSLGSIAWNLDGSGTYVPSANANGNDAIVVQAYDGWAWSERRTLTMYVAAVDDQPSDFLVSTYEFDENVALQSVLASVQVLDPDSDTDYQFQIADSRFEIIDGLLMLISGILNFESEPTIVLPIFAVNRLRPTETLTRTLTFSVTNQNDPPESILVPTNLEVPELTAGHVIGQVQVVDEDSDASYHWEISDPRFEIANSQLQLRPGISLDYESEPSIALTLRASDSTSSFFIERSINLSVLDRDDPPVGLRFTGSGDVSEHQPNAVIGSVSVIDQDRNETYSYEVSDERFFVNRGVIMLRPGNVLTRSGLSGSGSEYFDLTVIATSNLTGLQVRGTSRLSILRDSTPYHNDINPYDVDGDGRITPLDPLIIINHINSRGMGPLPPGAEGEEGPRPNIDVDGDGNVSPIDILILINRLNRQMEEEAEGDDESEDDSDGLPDGEGEYVSGPKSNSISPPMEANSIMTPMIPTSPAPSVFHITDVSLADYLDSLDRELGPKRWRRR